MILKRLNANDMLDTYDTLRASVLRNDLNVTMAFTHIQTPMDRAYRYQQEGIGRLERIIEKARVPTVMKAAWKRKKVSNALQIAPKSMELD